MELSSTVKARNATGLMLKPDTEESKAPATQPQLAVEGKSIGTTPHHSELTVCLHRFAMGHYHARDGERY